MFKTSEKMDVETPYQLPIELLEQSGKNANGSLLFFSRHMSHTRCI